MRYWTAAETDGPNWIQLISTGDNPWVPAGTPGGFVHISAVIDLESWADVGAVLWVDTSVGRGARVRDSAMVFSGATVGSDVIIGRYALIGRDADIGDGSWIASGVTVPIGDVVPEDAVVVK